MIGDLEAEHEVPIVKWDHRTETDHPRPTTARAGGKRGARFRRDLPVRGMRPIHHATRADHTVGRDNPEYDRSAEHDVDVVEPDVQAGETRLLRRRHGNRRRIRLGKGQREARRGVRAVEAHTPPCRRPVSGRRRERHAGLRGKPAVGIGRATAAETGLALAEIRVRGASDPGGNGQHVRVEMPIGRRRPLRRRGRRDQRDQTERGRRAPSSYLRFPHPPSCPCTAVHGSDHGRGACGQRLDQRSGGGSAGVYDLGACRCRAQSTRPAVRSRMLATCDVERPRRMRSPLARTNSMMNRSTA